MRLTWRSMPQKAEHVERCNSVCLKYLGALVVFCAKSAERAVDWLIEKEAKL